MKKIIVVLTLAILVMPIAHMDAKEVTAGAIKDDTMPRYYSHLFFTDSSYHVAAYNQYYCNQYNRTPVDGKNSGSGEEYLDFSYGSPKHEYDGYVHAYGETNTSGYTTISYYG